MHTSVYRCVQRSMYMYTGAYSWEVGFTLCQLLLSFGMLKLGQMKIGSPCIKKKELLFFL